MASVHGMYLEIWISISYAEVRKMILNLEYREEMIPRTCISVKKDVVLEEKSYLSFVKFQV